MSSSEEEEFLEVEDISNGLVLSSIYLPEEVLVNLLIFVSWRDLLLCRLVCRSWRRIIDSLVCFEKLKTFSFKTLKESFTGPISQLESESVPFYLYFAISKGAFGKNLLKNPFGSGDDPHVCQPNRDSWLNINFREEKYFNCLLCTNSDCPKYKHWGVLESRGDGWTVEPEPYGSEPLPAHLPERSCFATSYGWCKKEQVINLAENGLGAKIMDEVRPQIDISEWYARRWDCAVRYRLQVMLLDSQYAVIEEFAAESREDLETNEWQEVTHSFKDYGPGVRYILFIHAGIDKQYWAGHYGSKIAGGSVILRIPASKFQRSSQDVSLLS